MSLPGGRDGGLCLQLCLSPGLMTAELMVQKLPLFWLQ